MAKGKREAGRGTPAGSLTGNQEPVDTSALDAALWADAMDAVADADAFFSFSSYDGGRTLRVALQVRGQRWDEYVRDEQHLTAVLEAVAAKCMGDELVSRPSGTPDRS